MALRGHHHRLLFVERDDVESIAIHRQADKAELRGTVAQDLQLRAVVGHERVQRNVGHALFPAPDPFPGGHAGDVGESQPLGPLVSASEASGTPTAGRDS
ncbi:hypothetical protein AHiyo8_34120 [Arthrobacter sp. Hiyo8]|nr:hypothetical protein AHiyo8_34120 [Arthrobacter sp. Hiyo8]